MMWIDPIVKEIRESGEKYTTKFNHNLEVIFQDLKKKEKGRNVVYLNPKPYLPILKKE